MSKDKTGGEAFPRPSGGNSGMTLRDFIATIAMVTFQAQQLGSYDQVALKAYKQADAMIKIKNDTED